MADETPAPLSDAEIEMLRAAYAPLLDRNIDQPGLYLSRLFATLADRGTEIERLKSQVAIHETWRQDAELRYVNESRTLVAQTAELATLERENAAMREIVAAVANMDAITRYHLILRERARALLATQPPAPQPAE